MILYLTCLQRKSYNMEFYFISCELYWALSLKKIVSQFLKLIFVVFIIQVLFKI